MDNSNLEKYSSAITLSDMEIFVFPELMYSLLLANIMSPIIWKWREEDTFKKLKGKSKHRKFMRLKQFIMDEYEFNLDLETWGLTSQERELKRFEKYISPEDISRSNALFGYHGDQYYFDVDIRRHFGLDKYQTDIIPYWKTETVDAMTAFRLKPGYKSGAGECVSLAALYAAAAFVVCGIPLEDIFMVLTPLHSQNYLDLNGGVLTNNRRIVTKAMWFNGTILSHKAQRALRNEQVTIVSHNSGYVHCMYDEATIDRGQYERFSKKLRDFVTTKVDMLIFANFLREHSEYQKYFQICRDCHGNAQFMPAELLFRYEHSSNYRVADETHDKLMGEVHDEDLSNYELPNRMRCDAMAEFLDRREKELDLTIEEHRQALKEKVKDSIPDADQFIKDFASFVHFEPNLPGVEKQFLESEAIELKPEMSREQIIEYLQQKREINLTADLAFYAYRDMETCNWGPFVKAAIERNPVSIEAAKDIETNELYNWVQQIGKNSIYDGRRLAQPDEVINYNTGDGIEKAFLLANLLYDRSDEQVIQLIMDEAKVKLIAEREYVFESQKGIKKQIKINPARQYSEA